MKADPRWAAQGISFWAYVRAIGEARGYSRADQVLTHSVPEMVGALQKMGRPTDAVWRSGKVTEFGALVKEYFDFRAEVLNTQVRSDLMVADEAQYEFETIIDRSGAVLFRDNVNSLDYEVHGQIVRIPMNKQKNEKYRPSYLTGIVNLLVADGLAGQTFDYDPRALTSVDHAGALYAVLSRRMDGCYPSVTNPVAMWEIKEYYYTTTFGSKISDAVYITSLDGYERNELERATKIHIDHVVMMDAYDTWWKMGKSYLCRMVDVLNMGHVDEVLFGREVVRRLPELVADWAERAPSEPEVAPEPVQEADTLFTQES